MSKKGAAPFSVLLFVIVVFVLFLSLLWIFYTKSVEVGKLMLEVADYKTIEKAYAAEETFRFSIKRGSDALNAAEFLGLYSSGDRHISIMVGEDLRVVAAYSGIQS